MPVAARKLPAEVLEPPRAAPPRSADAELRRAFEREATDSSERRTGAERRGPLRPAQLVPVRARFEGAGPARAFRFVDGAAVLGLAAAVCGLSVTGGLLAAPIALVLPYLSAALAMVWSLKTVGAYGFGAHEGLSAHLLRAAAAILPTTAVLALCELLLRTGKAEATMASVWLALAFACVYLGHVAWWLIVARWRASGRLTPNIVVVGATRNAERLIQGLLETRDANVLGVFDDRLARAPERIRGVPVLGDTATLVAHRVMPYVDRIVVTVPASAQGRVRQIMERLRVLPNEISLFLDFDAQGQNAMLSRLADAPLARVAGAPRDERRAFWKRVQDLTIGSAALVVGLPLMAAIALAVRLDSKGPILFRQRRHGFNNEEIVVWKFRSMRQDAADATSARQVSADDERITRVGRIIRRTSLDELPQIFNVLKGEMSLVGPRPHAIGMKTGETESARLVAEYAHRHRLKPGMTGWAAIKGSRGPVDTPESVRRRVALDVDYIERQSFWLDLYIMAMTLPCLLGDRAAVR